MLPRRAWPPCPCLCAKSTCESGALDDAISQLPPQYGSILRLWVEDGLDLNEIQAHSGLSVSAIKSRLHRARRRIKAAIEARFGPGALMPA